MAIAEAKRLTLDELKKECVDVFYNTLASSTFFTSEIGIYEPCSEEYPTVAHLLYKETCEMVLMCDKRLGILKYSNDVQDVNTREKIMKLIENERDLLVRNNREKQEDRLARKVVNPHLSRIEIPLDKRINPLYDDMHLVVSFVDDVTTLNGKFEEYSKLETFEDRLQFLKWNTNVWRMSVALVRRFRPVAWFTIFGTPSPDAAVYEKELVDYENLSLADLDGVKNNDIRQILQTKIDLDKEKLSVIDEQDIRGSVYTLLERPPQDVNKRNMLYIRYVCPSTQRVYFNEVSFDYLDTSPYFEMYNTKTYIPAWWNITHLGMPIEGKVLPRC